MAENKTNVMDIMDHNQVHTNLDNHPFKLKDDTWMEKNYADRLKKLEGENDKLWAELKDVKQLLSKFGNQSNNSEDATKLQRDSKSEYKYVILSGIPFQAGQSCHDVFISFIEDRFKKEIEPNMVLGVEVLGRSADKRQMQVLAKVHQDLKDELSKDISESNDKGSGQHNLYFLENSMGDIFSRDRDMGAIQNNTDSHKVDSFISVKTNDCKGIVERKMNIQECNSILDDNQCSNLGQYNDTNAEALGDDKGHSPIESEIANSKTNGMDSVKTQGIVKRKVDILKECNSILDGNQYSSSDQYNDASTEGLEEDKGHLPIESEIDKSKTKCRDLGKSGKRKGYGSFVAAGILVHTMINIGKYGPKKPNSTT